ncbi:MAG TPA: PP2C family protein-serine/threonine phosphatase, partial [Candidatus Dormibacteraeota bacterium]|nr:PP2C family protein-serine/threonine phosphatase [Candidatus Dormibacteraeota bacterium]
LPGGRIGFSIGDVCGHGIDAAVKMGEAKQAIFVAASLGDPAPESVLRTANDVLFLNDQVSITTALYGMIDTVRRTVTYASAGHHPPVLAAANGQAQLLPNHGFPLGVESQMPSAIRTHEFAYESGSLMILYTDGLIEFDHDMLHGEQRLLAAASTAVQSRPEHPARFIVDEVLGGSVAGDDIAVLVISFRDESK